MRIEFASVSMMVDIINELRTQGIQFECKVGDIGEGYVGLRKQNEL